MKDINRETKTYKLLQALRDGGQFTAAQANKRFGIKNIRAEATRIRQAGYCVNTQRKISGNYHTITSYKIGTPSRELVAAGYLAQRLGLTV